MSLLVVAVEADVALDVVVAAAALVVTFPTMITHCLLLLLIRALSK
jgi:lipopolysaccharide/colanic/teichoic acid biosynthesis glycosyltransferase